MQSQPRQQLGCKDHPVVARRASTDAVKHLLSREHATSCTGLDTAMLLCCSQLEVGSCSSLLIAVAVSCWCESSYCPEWLHMTTSPVLVPATSMLGVAKYCREVTAPTAAPACPAPHIMVHVKPVVQAPGRGVRVRSQVMLQHVPSQSQSQKGTFRHSLWSEHVRCADWQMSQQVLLLMRSMMTFVHWHLACDDVIE